MINPNHDLTCDNCGDPATSATREVVHNFDIGVDGELYNEETWDMDETYYTCEKDECEDALSHHNKTLR